MELQSEKITLRGVEFEVRELTYAQVVANLKDNDDATLVMLGLSVHQDGKPLGAKARELPSAVGSKLIPIVTRLNGMTGEDEEGNG